MIFSKDYVCSSCGAKDCKLWREYGFVQNRGIFLQCCDCAGKSQNKDVTEIDEYGEIPFMHMKVNAIGWMIPAVPCSDGPGYWSYTSIPQYHFDCWLRLSTRRSCE